MHITDIYFHVCDAHLHAALAIHGGKMLSYHTRKRLGMLGTPSDCTLRAPLYCVRYTFDNEHAANEAHADIAALPFPTYIHTYRA